MPPCPSVARISQRSPAAGRWLAASLGVSVSMATDVSDAGVVIQAAVDYVNSLNDPTGLVRRDVERSSVVVRVALPSASPVVRVTFRA